MMKQKLGGAFATAILCLGALSAATGEEVAEAGRYRSPYVTASGANAEAIERECDAIVERLTRRYGAPARWRNFRVRIEPRRDGPVAGYTRYVPPNVVEVVSYRSLEESRGGVLDHEMTHAFFFYLVGSNFDLMMNEGVAQNSEYRTRAELREIVWRRYLNSEFRPLATLYGRNEYDSALLIYTEGFSVVDFLIGRGGSMWFAAFTQYLAREATSIDDALRAFYGYESLEAFEEDWLEFIRCGQSRATLRSL